MISKNCALYRRKLLLLIVKIIFKNRELYIIRLLIFTLLVDGSNIPIDAISEAPFSGFFSFAGLRIRNVFLSMMDFGDT